MAMNQEQRNEKLKVNRAKFAEKELRHRVRPGIEEALKKVRARAKDIETSELLQLAILKMDLMSDGELIEFLRYPRHEIVISENVARKFEEASRSELRGGPDD